MNEKTTTNGDGLRWRMDDKIGMPLSLFCSQYSIDATIQLVKSDPSGATPNVSGQVFNHATTAVKATHEERLITAVARSPIFKAYHIVKAEQESVRQDLEEARAKVAELEERQKYLTTSVEVGIAGKMAETDRQLKAARGIVEDLTRLDPIVKARLVDAERDMAQLSRNIIVQMRVNANDEMSLRFSRFVEKVGPELDELVQFHVYMTECYNQPLLAANASTLLDSVQPDQSAAESALEPALVSA